MKIISGAMVVLWSSIVMVFISVAPADALWSSNPAVNTPVIVNGTASTPQIISDGAGGAIIVWTDYRNGSYAKLFAQRLDAQGDPLWTAGGVELCTASGSQTGHQVISDGSGGAVVTWQDTRAGSNHIYAQRIDANGNVMWAAEGVAVCTASGGQYYPKIVSDYLGGAIITWIDMRVSTNGGDVYVQRIDASGSAAWTANGVAICVTPALQHSAVIATDGAGGAIIAWYDNRDGSYIIYAQRVYDDGTVGWPAYPNGKKITAGISGNQMSHAIAYDGMNGVVVAWRHGYDVSGWNIYAQRVLIDGTLYWGDGAVAVTTTGGSDTQPVVVTDDGNQGAVIAWHDNRGGGNLAIYAQRLNASGSAQWTPNGVLISSVGSVSQFPMIVGDGGGGAVMTWQGSDNYDIYAQRLNSSGSPQWAAGGIAVCTAENFQSSPQIIHNGIDGVIITWSDSRAAYLPDIYAQKILMSSGTLPACPRISITPSTLPVGSYNTSYSQTFSASGGAGPYSFGLTGDLPVGMSFSDPTLSGTPTSAGSFQLLLRATDSNACLATVDYTLFVKDDTTTTITSHLPDPSSGGQTVTINYTVTSLTGTPTGTVTVGDGTVSCSGTVSAGACSLEFHTAGSKTLTAQYSGDSSFNASISDGVLHTVTPSSIRINGTTPAYYATIQSVYDAATTGDTIQIQAGNYSETPDFDRDIEVTVQGGFNSAYDDNSGTTAILGSLTIIKGKVAVDNIAIY